jgi:glycosyltransferase involved in cell wall biosynthesis
MQHQILGLAHFLRAHREFVSANIICHLMFDHSWLPWGKNSALGKETYDAAFQIIETLRLPIHFTTENEFIAHAFAQNFHVKAGILPIPLSGLDINRREPGRIRFGFLGYSKMEKGFHLLPEAIAACIKAPVDVEFVLQINHHGAQEEVRHAEAALNNMPNVRLLRGQLSQEQYRSELAGIDVILLPYDPNSFGMRGSGVLTEAVSSGRVIVASQGTWAGHLIERGEAGGETFASHDAQALATAMLRVCSEFSRRLADAGKAAPVWASRNSIEAYVDNLLALASGSVKSAS